MNQTKHLNLITNLVTFNLGVTTDIVCGIKDTSEKIIACAIAMDCTDCEDKFIARHYQIDPYYMKKRIEDLQIQFLVGTESSKETISDLFNHARNIIEISELKINN